MKNDRVDAKNCCSNSSGDDASIYLCEAKKLREVLIEHRRFLIREALFDMAAAEILPSVQQQIDVLDKAISDEDSLLTNIGFVAKKTEGSPLVTKNGRL